MCFPGGPGGAGPAWEVMLELRRQRKPTCLLYELPRVFRVVRGAVAGGPASPRPCFWPRADARPGLGCSAAAFVCHHHPHCPLLPARGSCAGPRSSYKNSCELQCAGRSWEEWGSCLWQERDFIAPSEMSRWRSRRGRQRSSDAVDVCSQSPSLRRNQTSRGLALEAVAVTNVTHRG